MMVGTDGARPQVLQVITHLDLGGAEQVAVSLAEQLTDRVHTQFFAVMDAGQSAVADDIAARVAAIGGSLTTGTSLPFKRGGLMQAGVRLAWQIERSRPDLVHLHTELPEASWAIASLLSRRVRATPVLRTIHNARLWPAWGTIGRWAERRLGDRHAVAVSQGALRGLATLRRAAGLAPMPLSGSEVIYNGVMPARKRAAPEIPFGRPVHVLFAGRLEPQKGADLLPEIWHAACAKASRPAQLTVLGDGSLRRMIEAHAVNDARMAIVPPVPRLADVLHGYDVLLMPSRFEGLGIVAVEAFMAGLSIVAFNAPGLREVVPASHPKLPQVGDVEALAALLAAAIDDPSRFRSPETERIVRERFAMAKMRQAYTEVYAKMISVTPRVLPSSRLEPKQDEGHC